MSEQFANHAGTTLAAAITSTARPVTFSVASATGLPASGNFRVVIGSEILLVTSISGTSLTGSNVEGTTAATYALGQAVTHVVTAGALAQVELDVVSTMLSQANTFTAAQTTFDANVVLATASVATSGANYAAAALQFGNSYWTGSAAGSDAWSLTPTLGTGANPASTLTLAHSGSSGAATFQISSAATLGGNLLFSTDNSFNIGSNANPGSRPASVFAATSLQVGASSDSASATLTNTQITFARLGNAYTTQATVGGTLVFRVSKVSSGDSYCLVMATSGNVAIGGSAVQSYVSPTTALQINGTLSTIALATPGAPTVTPTGTNSANTNYAYLVVANQSDGSHTVAGSATSISGNSSLSGTNYNALSWSAVTNAYSYTIYRTVDGRSSGSSTGAISTAQTGLTLNDTGLAASGNVPAANTTGGLAVAGPVTGAMGGWQSWTPTVTCSGSMTASGVTFTISEYLQVGPIVYFILYGSLTIGGTPSFAVNFSAPVTILSGQTNPLIAYVGSASNVPGAGFAIAGTGLQMVQSGSANYSAGSVVFALSGFYRSA